MRQRSKRRFLFLTGALTLIVSFFNTASAGSQTGQVKSIVVRASDGLVFLELTGTAADKPACATHSYWMIADEKSLAGKQQLAMFLLAQSTGQVVNVAGSGSCTRWSDGEDINQVILSLK